MIRLNSRGFLADEDDIKVVDVEADLEVNEVNFEVIEADLEVNEVKLDILRSTLRLLRSIWRLFTPIS